jgi:hypothetical protein
VTEQALNPADVRIELERLAKELKRASGPKHKAEIHRLADKWLDESLSHAGAHPPSCRCDSCMRVVGRYDLGEGSDLGVASVAEWGTAG